MDENSALGHVEVGTLSREGKPVAKLWIPHAVIEELRNLRSSVIHLRFRNTTLQNTVSHLEVENAGLKQLMGVQYRFVHKWAIIKARIASLFFRKQTPESAEREFTAAFNAATSKKDV